MHAGHLPAPLLAAAGPVLALLLLVYLAAAARFRLRGKRWSAWHGASFAVGVALLMGALSPTLAGAVAQGFTGHMVQHLLIGMYAPLFLVLAAPLTLALATLPPRPRRRLARLPHTRPLRALGLPLVAATLDVGGMYLLYLTPLYAIMLGNGMLHALMLLHVFLAGYVFAWSIAGLDPVPRRPSVRHRMIVLVLAMAAHRILAKLMYAEGQPRGTPFGSGEIEAAAQLMAYGGDLAEVGLAVALFGAWHHRRGWLETQASRRIDEVTPVAVTAVSRATTPPMARSDV